MLPHRPNAAIVGEDPRSLALSMQGDPMLRMGGPRLGGQPGFGDVGRLNLASLEAHMANQVMVARLRAAQARDLQTMVPTMTSLPPSMPGSPQKLARPTFGAGGPRVLSPVKSPMRRPQAVDLLRRAAAISLSDPESCPGSPVKASRPMLSSLNPPSPDSVMGENGRLYVEEIREWDVMCGRGGRSNHHSGNKRYRHVVSEMKMMYRNTEAKAVKTDLSRAIVEHVCNYGGRFIKKDEETGRYFVLTKAEARKKTSQALRETKELKWTV